MSKKLTNRRFVYKRKRRLGRFRKRKSSAMTTAKRALRVAKSIAKKTEIKTDEDSNTGVVLTGGVTFDCSPSIAQGTTTTTRIGREINLKSFTMRINFKKNAATDHLQGRILFVKDLRCNGVLPVVTDVLNTATAHSLYNISEAENRGRFQILFDKMITIPENISSKVVKMYFNKRLGKSVYKATSTGGAIGDLEVGAFAIFWIPVNAALVHTCDWQGRWRFYD